MRTSSPERRGADFWIAVALAALAVLYLTQLPPILGPADDAYYLYHAKRTLHGEVAYLDFFDFLAPLLVDVYALLFAIFGTTIRTAQLADAAMHALATAVLYVTARSVGVRRALAVVVGIAYLAVARSAWEIVSPHWLGALLVVSMLLACLHDRHTHALRSDLVTGLLLGTLLVVQQHTGAVFVAAPCLVVWTDRLIDRRFGVAATASTASRLAAILGTAALVVGVVMGIHALRAGIRPIVEQLVLYPFTGYREYNAPPPWANVGKFSQRLAQSTFPLLLKYLPAILPVVLVRAAVLWAGRRDRERLRALVVLLVFAVVAIASILYFPDYIHVAFIAPVFLVILAEGAEWVLTLGGRRRTAAGWAVAVVLAAVLGAKLARNLSTMRAAFPVLHDTAFGRVAFRTPREAALIDRLRTLVGSEPGRELFCYPVFASLYLTADTNNPTRHDWIMPRFQSDTEMRGVTDTLERRRVPYVVLLGGSPDDPVVRYVREHYECGDDWICTRKPDGAAH